MLSTPQSLACVSAHLLRAECVPSRHAESGCCGLDQVVQTVSHPLQAHVLWHWDRLPRIAFQRLVTPTKCQLWIPFPGEQVVLLRSGLLKHIDADMKALRLSLEDSAAAEAAGGLAAACPLDVF